jgi:integrase/recombinase XerD
MRLCPLWDHTVQILRDFLGDRLQKPAEAPVFLNARGQRLTRFGAYSMVERLVARAATRMPSLKMKRVSPHSVRHATAVRLLRAGVDINTIRAWLGHVSPETTNRDAEIDLEMKSKALAACAVSESNRPGNPSAAAQRKPQDLMAFLASL